LLLGFCLVCPLSTLEIDHVMQAGKKNRSVGETLMNKSSSRSHSIFTIVVECADSSGDHIRVGKLNLVDLAGSERQSKTGTGFLSLVGLLAFHLISYRFRFL
jgi:hypothetical protein